MPQSFPPDITQVRRYQASDVEAAEIDAWERQHQQELLDEALKETFPASDPVAIVVSSPPANMRMNQTM